MGELKKKKTTHTHARRAARIRERKPGGISRQGGERKTNRSTSIPRRGSSPHFLFRQLERQRSQGARAKERDDLPAQNRAGAGGSCNHSATRWEWGEAGKFSCWRRTGCKRNSKRGICPHPLPLPPRSPLLGLCLRPQRGRRHPSTGTAVERHPRAGHEARGRGSSRRTPL